MNPRNLSFATTIFLSVLFASTSWGQPQCEDITTSPFSEARMIIEYNSTAEDVGIQVFVDAERRRRFARVQHAQPPARAGADVAETVSGAQRSHDLVDGLLDLRKRRAHRARNGRVLIVHQLEDLARRE